MSVEVSAGGVRAVVVRHELRGMLRTDSALRVGGWGASAHADLTVARDGLDRLLVPGTSLAGALRAWLAGLTEENGARRFASLDTLFGRMDDETRPGQVSRVRVDDAVAVGPVTTRTRDGVGIDRRSGAAAAGFLYQHEVVPPGTRFALRILAEERLGDPERVAEALDLIAAGLRGGQIGLGAARTRGLGAVRLVDSQRFRIDLRERSQVVAWLSGHPPAHTTAATGPAGFTSTPGQLTIDIDWAPRTPVMVTASTVSEPSESPGAEPPQVVALREDTLDAAPRRLLLPGSSIKGVLRGHAERVVRTMRGLPVPQGWAEQVNDPELAPVAALFGAARTSDDGSPTGVRGALSAADCHGTTDTEAVITHVAVDRWTGGAATNLLFSVREPRAAHWEPIRLRVEVGRLTEPTDDSACALVLLLLLLRDLADGWLAFGFGGTRGRGSVTVSSVRFAGQALPQPWDGLPGRTLDQVLDAPPPGIGRAVATWREWVNR